MVAEYRPPNHQTIEVKKQINLFYSNKKSTFRTGFSNFRSFIWISIGINFKPFIIFIEGSFVARGSSSTYSADAEKTSRRLSFSRQSSRSGKCRRFFLARYFITFQFLVRLVFIRRGVQLVILQSCSWPKKIFNFANAE